ncbi:hypothetical protein [Dyella sp. GSA-30]|uniref:hypothetical protein n=1 Tax=Dyella sp. GSA-30 TaxID=2994496 RepID=UPI00249143F6|nr:hypothetical protein [Dyella sp. GSA-30]BDU18940.1 hypothetical protein DYGSA30_03970 [Dyella sp. GSA-30]
MRTIFLGPLALLLALCGGLVAYDRLYFQPALTRTRTLVSQHPASDRSPPQLFVQLLIFTTHGDTVPYATRVLMTSGDPDDNAKPIQMWQARYVTWSLLVALHTSESERNATIASLGFRAEPEHGLTDVAQHRFGKEPGQLSRLQVAMLAKLLVLGPNDLNEAQLANHATLLLDTFDQSTPRRPAARRGPTP